MEMWRITLAAASHWQIISKIHGSELLLVFVVVAFRESLWLAKQRG